MFSKSWVNAVFIFLFLSIGCAPKAPNLVIQWPALPEEPRVAYVAMYRGESDFEKPGFFDNLLGREISIDIPRPYGIASHGGNIYVSDTDRRAVIILNPSSKTIRNLDMSGQGMLLLPLGITASVDGTVYVADAKQKVIKAYDSSGKWKKTIGEKSGLVNPVGLAVNDKLNRIYVCDSRNSKVSVFSTNGEKLLQFGNQGKGDTEFRFPTFIAVDKRNSNVVVVDSENGMVKIFDQDGKFIRKFGETGDGPGTFTKPKGIGVDSDGHIYVVDAALQNVQIFDENGVLMLYIAEGGSKPGQFQLPSGVFIDANDTIYVADQLNQRVQIFQYLSERWKKEHPEEYKKLVILPTGFSGAQEVK